MTNTELQELQSYKATRASELQSYTELQSFKASNRGTKMLKTP